MSGVAWVVVTAANLRDYLVAAQVTALQTAALAAGQADPFDAIMPDVAARVRAAIRSNKTNLLSETANSVPPELKWVTCLLIVEQMQTRIPSLNLTDSQKEVIRSAKDALKDVANGDTVVSRPVDATAGAYQTGGNAEVVTSSTRIAKREQTKGLL